MLRIETQRNARARGGFTLIELLAVMAILAVLSTVGIVAYRKFQIAAEEDGTRARMLRIKTMIEAQYEPQTGDYPPDTFAKIPGAPVNDTNIGSEALAAALAAPNKDWDAPQEDSSNVKFGEVCNTDEDKFTKKTTRYQTLDAYECADAWKNPIVYFNRKSFGKKQKTLAKPRGKQEYRSFEVVAAVNPETGAPRGAESFQLISAGYDGEFGTDDDIIITGK